MAHLYLIDSDVKVGLSQGEVVITSLTDGNERRLPFAELEDVSVFGMAQLSTRLVRECISKGVPVLYYSEDGHYFGRTSSLESVNPARQRLQVLLADDGAFCLQWARTVVDAKIRNSLALLDALREYCELSEEDVRGLTHALGSLGQAESVEAVIGHEGNAAKCYFACLSKAVVPEGLRFKGRSTRPPRDPVNSMLSYGYSFLYRNVIGAIERHGLHPHFAFMHKVAPGHAALASDLVEDLRAPVVDALVMELVNSGEVGLDDFTTGANGAVYMGRSLMRRLTAALSQYVVQGRPFLSAYGDPRSYGFQAMLDRKVASVAEAVEEGDATLYRPLIWEPVS